MSVRALSEQRFDCGEVAGQPCRMDSGVGLISVRYFVKAGGLIPIAQTSQNSFSKHCILDRILKGERPTDLSVQAPTKYELAVNISSAVRKNAGVYRDGITFMLQLFLHLSIRCVQSAP